MSDVSPTTIDSAGVTRTPEGQITSPSQTPTSPPASSTTQQNPPASTSQDSKTSQSSSSFLNEGDKPADKPAAPTGAPEAYADFKLPDGYVLAEELKTETHTLLKELGLNQDQAQKAVDFYTKHTSEAMQAPYNAYLETRKEWRDAIAADPTVGQGKQDQVKAVIGRAINSLGDPRMVADFREALDVTGIGDHPAFVRAFYAFAQRLGEGHAVRGEGPSAFGQGVKSTAPPSAAQAIYPHLKSNG